MLLKASLNQKINSEAKPDISLKKVLIISYYWPPSGGAGVQRWLKFVKYLPQLGWEPHIYTPSNPEAPAMDNSLEKDIPKEAIIIKRPIIEPYSFYKRFTGKKGNVNAGFLSEEKDSRKKFTEKLSIWVRGNIFIPDARVLWVKPSIKFLSNYIEKNNIGIIISSGPPHSMHLIAMALKKKKNYLKWIADFRDPWTDIDFYADLMLSSWADKKHHRLEKEVLQTADTVISIGETMANELAKVRGSKVEVITNGYDEDDFNITPTVKNTNFNIVHVGSINEDRNHQIFWQAIHELIAENEEFAQRVKVHLIGKLDYSVYASIEKFNLANYIEITSYIPHNEIVAHLSQANVLYLPLNNTPNTKGILSGKFFEYLAMDKAIVAIGSIDGDAAKIMRKVDAGIIVDFQDLAGFKKALGEEFERRNYPFIIDNEKRKQYSRRKLSEKLIKLF